MSEKEIDFDLIRTALIQYAESRGRPHFDVVIVREVINAFINGTEHWLKGVVDSFSNSSHWCDMSKNKKRAILLSEMTSRKGERAKLSKLMDIHPITLGRMRSGRMKIKDEEWSLILDNIDKIKEVGKK